MLNFIFWVILIYFALRLIWRFVVPYLLKRYMKKVEHRFNQYAHQQSYNQSREGEVRIDHIPDQEPIRGATSSDLDYIDFEEIKDTDKHP